MRNNVSGNAGKQVLTIVLIVANVLMLVAGILTIPPNFRGAGDKKDATSLAASLSPSATEGVLPSITPAPEPTTTPMAPTTKPLEQADALELTLKLRFEGSTEPYTGVYTGELLSGLPHGQGSFSSRDRDDDAFVYTGQWNAGSFDGEGKLEWEYCTRSGSFRDGLLHGPGQQYNNSILVFDGVYENHLMANGKLYDNSGQLFYEGEFREGQRLEDSAALEARIAGYNQICVPFTLEVLNNFSGYAGQILLIDCEVTKITPDAFGTPELYFTAVLLDGNEQHTLTWSSDYCPVYGEILPGTDDGTLAFILVHAGPKGTYGQLLALAPYESQ